MADYDVKRIRTDIERLLKSAEAAQRFADEVLRTHFCDFSVGYLSAMLYKFDHPESVNG